MWGTLPSLAHQRYTAMTHGRTHRPLSTTRALSHTNEANTHGSSYACQHQCLACLLQLTSPSFPHRLNAGCVTAHGLPETADGRRSVTHTAATQVVMGRILPSSPKVLL